MLPNNTSNLPLAPLRGLNFATNCTLVARFFQGYTANGGSTLGATVNYVRQALPDSRRNKSVDQIINMWDTTIANDNFSAVYLDRPIAACRRDICQMMPWPGNSDVGGTLMIAAFFIEAILTTAFFIAYLMDHNIGKVMDHRKHKGPYNRFLNACEGTSGLFLDSVLLFSLAISLASLYLGLTTTSAHDLISTTLASSLTALPILTIWPLQLQIQRRQEFRGFLRSQINIILGLHGLVVSQRAARWSGNSWESTCYAYGVENLPYVNILISFFTFLSILSVLTDGTPLPLFHSRIAVDIQKFILSRPFITSFGTIGIWTLLGVLLVSRNQVENIVGNGFRVNDWGYGQILALITWIPVLVDFGHLFFNSPKKGLEGRIPRPWQVQKGGEPENTSEEDDTHELTLVDSRQRRRYANHLDADDMDLDS